MQRIINNPDNLVDEMVEGFKLTHDDIVAPTGNPRVLKYINAPVPGKVGIVTGGGSGHKPDFIVYIGENMIDAVAVGEIFSSPTGRSFYDAIKAADSGKGVAVLYGNYSGDNMNVKMAKAEAEDDDITVKTVVANDDVPSATPLLLSRSEAGADGTSSLATTLFTMMSSSSASAFAILTFILSPE